VNGLAITKPTGVGIYRCTLADNYSSVLAASGVVDGNAVTQGLHFEVSNVDLTAGANVIDFQLSSGRRTVAFPRKAQDAAASTTTTETAIGSIVEGSRIIGAYIVPDAAVTADAANYATITVSKRTSAGASKTTLATLLTDVAGGSWTQYARKEMTLTATTADRICGAGSTFTIEVAKAGTGVQLPVLTIGLEFATQVDATNGDEAYFTLILRDGAAPRVGL
jgi:hypothetical protein